MPGLNWERGSTVTGWLLTVENHEQSTTEDRGDVLAEHDLLRVQCGAASLFCACTVRGEAIGRAANSQRSDKVNHAAIESSSCPLSSINGSAMPSISIRALPAMPCKSPYMPAVASITPRI